MDLLHDTSIWVLASFIVFIFIMWKFAKDKFLALLDNRIEEIKKEIETAEGLRIEAQELLAQYQRKQRDSKKEADQIIATAKQHAKEIKKNAEIELEEMAKRREALHKDRLKRMEENTIQEIQIYAADLALKATQEIISNQLDKKSNVKIVDESIKNVSKQLAA
jgi:F-type H+-transporting ATPase subunit b